MFLLTPSFFFSFSVSHNHNKNVSFMWALFSLVQAIHSALTSNWVSSAFIFNKLALNDWIQDKSPCGAADEQETHAKMSLTIAAISSKWLISFTASAKYCCLAALWQMWFRESNVYLGSVSIPVTFSSNDNLSLLIISRWQATWAKLFNNKSINKNGRSQQKLISQHLYTVIFVTLFWARTNKNCEQANTMLNRKCYTCEEKIFFINLSQQKHFATAHLKC